MCYVFYKNNHSTWGKSGVHLNWQVSPNHFPVYKNICNVLKCRPPGNRDPLPAEKSTCVDYLKKQIEIIQPKIICTLGNHATDFIFKEFGLESELKGISKIHGKVFIAPGFRIVSLYHPAVATYNPGMKATLLEDIKVLGEFI